MRVNIRELNQHSPAPFDKLEAINLSSYIKAHNLYFDRDKSKSRKNATVPLDRIIGQDQGWSGITWNSLLMNHSPSFVGSITKRMNINLNLLNDDPNKGYYYLSEQPKDGISLIQVGDYYFIDEGKHRVTIAKYLASFNHDLFGENPQIHGVEVTKYQLDEDYMNALEDIAWLEVFYPHLSVSYSQPHIKNERCILIINQNHSYRSGSYTLNEFKAVMNELRAPCFKRLFLHDGYSLFYSWSSVLRLKLSKISDEC